MEKKVRIRSGVEREGNMRTVERDRENGREDEGDEQDKERGRKEESR